uniref:AraC family transcriptional regulator n=1 Tax=Panagrellus redivivus TaxID=6233 RepID=A0A7E4V543_PANRE
MADQRAAPIERERLPAALREKDIARGRSLARRDHAHLVVPLLHDTQLGFPGDNGRRDFEPQSYDGIWVATGRQSSGRHRHYHV